jgi:hypothetical protein
MHTTDDLRERLLSAIEAASDCAFAAECRHLEIAPRLRGIHRGLAEMVRRLDYGLRFQVQETMQLGK